MVRIEKSGSVSVWHSDSAERHLHWLLDEHQLALEVAGEEQAACGHQRDQAARVAAGRYAACLVGLVAPLVGPHHQPGAHRRDEDGRGEESSGHRVQERPGRGVVGQQGAEVDEFGAAGLRVVLGATGCCMKEFGAMMK